MKRPSAGLTPTEAETLAQDGVVRLPGLIPAADTAAMADQLWRRIEAKHGYMRGRPETWTAEGAHHLGRLNFAAMGHPAVRAVVDGLLGSGRWEEPIRWGQPLVTFPTRGRAWDVPDKVWHLDIPLAPIPYPVARLFVILEPLEAHGGGTVYVTGAHRVLHEMARGLPSAIASASAKRLLQAREPWFAALFSRREGEDRVVRFMNAAGEAGGIAVRVREMTGEPGDLIVMDPVMPHSPAPNARSTPRMMLTQWIYTRDPALRPWPPGG